MSESETIMLSREDTIHANNVAGKVDLMGYRQLNFSQLAKETEIEIKKTEEQQKALMEKKQELGVLELMFGGDNMHKNYLNEQALEYMEDQKKDEIKKQLIEASPVKVQAVDSENASSLSSHKQPIDVV